jgi:3-oxoacyl-[acyl-carrier protein] reductase
VEVEGMRLKDKVAIITGSARGIGREYAIRFSQEGAKVVVCDVLDCGETVREIEMNGGEVLSLVTDVSSEASTVDLAKKTVERFGRIDILVNNAAVFGGLVLKPFYEVTVEEWDKLMAVNLKGVWLCCKAVFPFMRQQSKGKIINIASSVAFSGNPDFIHYTTSKGGVISFTKALARALGDYNISVNAIAPGLIQTQATLDMMPLKSIETFIAGQCLKWRQEPKYIVDAAVFLASEESNYITGQTMVVDGGRVLH